MKRLALGLLLLMVVASMPALAAAPESSEPATPSREELEKKFAADLSGATLVGHFTMSDKASSPKEERYSISKVTKIKDDQWRFDTRIVYGDHDVTVPLHLAVKWAGDTPVITLTDLTIPGLGTYTARVLIYRGQYAGTWSAGDHGGQLFGRIEKKNGDEPGHKSPDKPTPSIK